MTVWIEPCVEVGGQGETSETGEMHGQIIEWTPDSKMAPIHSYVNCSMAQGNIKETYASSSWEPSHALVHHVTDAEIFLFLALLAL